MADADFDVDDMLEESYRKEFNERPNGADAKNGRSRTRSPRKEEKKEKKKRSRSRDRVDKDKPHDRKDKKRSRSRSRDRRKRSKSRERGERRRSRDRGDRHGGRRDRSPRRRQSPARDSRRGGSPRLGGRGLRRSKTRSPSPVLTAEDRDARTIFIMQLSQRVRARDVEDFFSSVGKIRDVKLIMCNKTRRFKGIAYVEYRSIESVPLALGLSGQKLLGVPVIVNPSQAEKNRVGNYGYMDIRSGREKGPMKLYVGSLHFNITEDMLKGIFEPFGSISQIQLMTDPETGRSKGFGFITYAEADDAKKALEQMNGFELAGRAMKVGHVTERTDFPVGPSGLDSDEMDRAGIDLGATGRLALMAKLAEGTGMKLPDAASQALSTAAAAAASMNSFSQPQQPQPAASAPPIATQCFMLSNMFDPATETNPDWDLEVRDDVVEECSKHGGVLHIFVDKVTSQGNVYAKCASVAVAAAAVNALHGRWFAGKVITAAYVPVVNYHNLFPDAMTATQPLTARR